MNRKLALPVIVISLLGLVSSTLAADKTWNASQAPDYSWCNSGNWTGGTPGPGDTAIISTPAQGPVIDCSVDVGTIKGPAWNVSSSQTMDIASGTVAIGSWARDTGGTGTATINISGSPDITIGGWWRGLDKGTWIVDISGNPTIAVAGDWRGADESSGTISVTVGGGEVTCSKFMIGDDGGGELNVSGSATIITNEMDLGGLRGTAPITINMTGGYIGINGPLKAPANSQRDGALTINLYDGTIECDSFTHAGVAYSMDVTKGTLIIAGDVSGDINADITAGYITAYGGDGTVNVDLVDGNTVVTASQPEKAREPSPQDGAKDVCPNAILSWTPGIYAADPNAHHVYLGTEYNDVNDANTTLTLGVYMGAQSLGANSYDPCGLLELGTTYLLANR